MSTARRIQTNFSKGELSPRLEGRPDLAAFFEGALTLSNWYLLRQGGITRRPGTRFVAEVKDSSTVTLLFPFEFSVNDAYILEFGELYVRFYRGGAPLLEDPAHPPSFPVEVVTPYHAAELNRLHVRQVGDVLWLIHPDHAPTRLSRISEQVWAITPIAYRPPPSLEVDVDISDGALIGSSGLPSIAITAPLFDAVVSGVVTITATAFDPVGIAGVQFRVNGVNQGIEVVALPYETQWDTTPLGTGWLRQLTAVVRNLAGQSTISAPVTVRGEPDPAPPPPPPGGGDGGGGDGGE